MQATNLSRRDPEVARRHATSVDMRHSRRRAAGALSEDGLIAFASTVVSRSAFNRALQPEPKMRRELRSEANACIHNHNRLQRARVLRLAQAEAAAASEHSALSHEFAKLYRAAEEPERMLWLIDKSEQLRQTRCISEDDGVNSLIRAERAAAKRWLGRIQDALAETKAALESVQSARMEVRAQLKKDKQGNELNSDTYSGAVTNFPEPLGDDPPCMSILASVYSASQQQRRDVEALIADSGAKLKASRDAVEAATRRSIDASHRLQRNLAFAKGEIRLAKNQVERNRHLLEIRQQVNEGPAEGTTYLETSERYNRPLVRHFNSSGRLGVTDREKSSHSFQQFQNSRITADNDSAELELVARALSATLHDRTRTKEVNEVTQRLRATVGPDKRA